MMSSGTNTHIQAVIFDLGGVLIDWQREHLYRKVFAGDPAGMSHFLTEICPMEWNLLLDKGHPFAQAVEEKVAQFPAYEEQIRAYQERWEEMVTGHFQQNVALLPLLRQKGFDLHVLSNFSAETFPLIRSRFEFLAWFDSVLLSGDVGLTKPDPEIYLLMLSRIGLKPEQCLFIDDSLQNVVAALDLGIDAIHYTSSEALHQNLLDRNLI